MGRPTPGLQSGTPADPQHTFRNFGMNILVLAAGLTLASPFAAADLLSLKAGAGYWQGDYSGSVGEPSINTEQLGLDDSNNNYFYLAFEHFLPIIPNARVQHTRISSGESAAIDRKSTRRNSS